jgi:hypothetical protein
LFFPLCLITHQHAVLDTEVFHGTKAIKQIWDSEDGFDMRFSDNGMWGQGIYFAVNANSANEYCSFPTFQFQSSHQTQLCCLCGRI